MADENVKIGIQVDTEQFDKSIKEILGRIKDLKTATQSAGAGEGLKKASKDVGGLAQNWKQVAAGVFTGTAAYNAFMEAGRRVLDFTKQSIKAAQDEQVDQKKLFNALDQNTDAYIRMSEYKDKLVKTTTFSKDEIDNAVSMGLELGRTEEQTQKMIEAAMGLSKVTGQDLSSSLQQLSATYEGNIGRLGKYSSELKNLTKEQLVNGDAIDIISEKFGKFATQGLDTAAGSADQLAKSVNELQVAFGEKFLGVLTEDNKLLKGIVDTMTDLIKVPMSQKLQEQSDAMNSLIATITSLNEGDELRKQLLDELIATYPEYFGQIDTETIKNNELLLLLNDVNASYEKKIKLMIQNEKLSTLDVKALEAYKAEQDALDKINETYKEIFGNIGIGLTAYQKLNAIAKSSGIVKEITNAEGQIEQVRTSGQRLASDLQSAWQKSKVEIVSVKKEVKDINTAITELKKNDKVSLKVETNIENISKQFDKATTETEKKSVIKKAQTLANSYIEAYNKAYELNSIITSKETTQEEKNAAKAKATQLAQDFTNTFKEKFSLTASGTIDTKSLLEVKNKLETFVKNLKKSIVSVPVDKAVIKAEEERIIKINDLVQRNKESAAKIRQESLLQTQKLASDEIEIEIEKVDQLVKLEQISSDEAIKVYKEQYDKKKKILEQSLKDEEAIIQAQILQIDKITKIQGFVDPESAAKLEQLLQKQKEIRTKYAKDILTIDKEYYDKSQDLLDKDLEKKKITLDEWLDYAEKRITEDIPKVRIDFDFEGTGKYIEGTKELIDKEVKGITKSLEELEGQLKSLQETGRLSFSGVEYQGKDLEKQTEFINTQIQLVKGAISDWSEIKKTLETNNLQEIFNEFSKIDTKKFSFFEDIEAYITRLEETKITITERINKIKEQIKIKISELETGPQTDQSKKQIEDRKKDIEYYDQLGKNLNIDIDGQINAAKTKVQDFQKELKDTLVNGMIGLINQGLNAAIDLQLQYLQQATDNALKALDKTYEKNSQNLEDLLKYNLITQKQYDRKKEQLQAETERQKGQLLRKQAQYEKDMAIARILINTAVGVMQGFAQAGPLGAALAAITIAAGAIEMAAVEAAPIPEYEKGGLIKGPSHKEGGVKMKTPDGPVELEGGEYVIRKSVVKKKGVKELLENINNSTYTEMPKFETGGLINSVSKYTIPDSKTFNSKEQQQIINNTYTTQQELNTDELKSVIREIVNIPVTVVESDITTTQRRVSVIEQRSNW